MFSSPRYPLRTVGTSMAVAKGIGIPSGYEIPLSGQHPVAGCGFVDTYGSQGENDE